MDDPSDLTKATWDYRTNEKATTVVFDGISIGEGISDAPARPRRDSGVTGGLNVGNTPTSGSITP